MVVFFLNFSGAELFSDVTALDRVDLDWLYDRPVIQTKYVITTQQLADILTNGSFLTLLVNIMPHATFT